MFKLKSYYKKLPFVLKNVITMDFLKQILRGDKKLLKITNQTFLLEVPRIEELRAYEI